MLWKILQPAGYLVTGGGVRTGYKKRMSLNMCLFKQGSNKLETRLHHIAFFLERTLIMLKSSLMSTNFAEQINALLQLAICFFFFRFVAVIWIL